MLVNLLGLPNPNIAEGFLGGVVGVLVVDSQDILLGVDPTGLWWLIGEKHFHLELVANFKGFDTEALLHFWLLLPCYVCNIGTDVRE